MRHLADEIGTANPSLLRELDPRAKVVTVAAALLLMVSEPRTALAPFVGYGGLVVILLLLGRVPPRRLLVRLAIAFPVVAGAGLFLALAPQAGGAGGPRLALAMALKATTAVALATLLVSIEGLRRILGALGSLGMPPALTAVAAFMYRYAFVLADEVVRTTRARVSRTPGRLRVGRVEVYGRQAAMVFLRGWRRAQRVQQAMASRGFTGVMPAELDASLRVRDGIFVVVTVAAFAAVRVGWP